MRPASRVISTWLLTAVACLSASPDVAAAGAAAMAAATAPSQLSVPAVPAPSDGIPGLATERLDPDAWSARLPAPDASILDRAQIDAQNARMRALDPSLQDIATLPAHIDATAVRATINALSRWPRTPLFGEDGQAITTQIRARVEHAMGLQTLPARVTPEWGLVVRRASLRTFPTTLRVFSSPGDTDIDRFQESALFPGDKVAVVHRSRDGHWLFIQSERYNAWIRADAVALGERSEVLDFGLDGPIRVITGATAFTAYTPEEPRVSRLQLDMGVRLPVIADWPASMPVNGQQPQAGWVLRMPARDTHGRLQWVPALLPRSEDSAPAPLPLTSRNLLLQSFKFLGERYGWGHDYAARDCSGFVSEIYRSFGILMPRNTGAQATSPALDRLAFGPGDGVASRAAALAGLRIGDLVYIPGHVMMVIGHVDGEPWVIHDIAGGRWHDGSGALVEARLNGVSVTPLRPLMLDAGTSYVDAITSIQRMRPHGTPTPQPAGTP